MFLGSIALGAGLGVCYDLFRVLRVAVATPPAVVAVEDVVFAAVCAAATLVYLICADCGEIRLFVLVGEAVGFTLYHCTIGAVVIGAARGIIGAVKRALGWLWRLFVAPILCVIEAIRGILSKFMKKLAECIKTTAKNSKIHLKKHSGILYNLRKRLRRDGQKKTDEGRA